MRPNIEIVGGADAYQAAAIAAAVQAIIAEEEDKAKQLSTVSRWKPEIEPFQPGTWGVLQPGRDPREAG